MRAELTRMRQILRAALPEQAFLRRDRGDALFITNAPVFSAARPDIPGFSLIPEGRILRILPDSSWMQKLENISPPDHLSASLERFRGAEADTEGLALLMQGLKLLDMAASVPANELEAFDRTLRQRAALALRGAASGGGLYAAAILNHQIHKGE